jgi:hypothetical protein
VATTILDALIAILCLICAGFLLGAYRITRAPGLGFLAAGFGWSIILRIVILYEVAPLIGYRSWLVFPSFILYAIGCWRLWLALKSYYPPTAAETRRRQDHDKKESRDA